jgi:hypothetical protein
VGGQHHPQPFYPGEETRYSLYRRLGVPHGRSGRLRKTSLPQGFDLQTIQPVAVHYINWAIPAHTPPTYVKQNLTFFKGSPNFFPASVKAPISKVDAYCWAITRVAGRPCCGWSGASVLDFGFLLDRLTHKHVLDHTHTHTHTHTLFLPGQNSACAGLSGTRLLRRSERICTSFAWPSNKKRCAACLSVCNRPNRILLVACVRKSIQYNRHPRHETFVIYKYSNNPLDYNSVGYTHPLFYAFFL